MHLALAAAAKVWEARFLHLPASPTHLRRALPSHIARGPHYTRLCGSSDTANASPLAPAAVSLATSSRLVSEHQASTLSPGTTYWSLGLLRPLRRECKLVNLGQFGEGLPSVSRNHRQLSSRSGFLRSWRRVATQTFWPSGTRATSSRLILALRSQLSKGKKAS